LTLAGLERLTEEGAHGLDGSCPGMLESCPQSEAQAAVRRTQARVHSGICRPGGCPGSRLPSDAGCNPCGASQADAGSLTPGTFSPACGPWPLIRQWRASRLCPAYAQAPYAGIGPTSL